MFSSNDIPFSAIYDQNCIQPKAEKNRLASDKRHVDNGAIQVSELQIERGRGDMGLGSCRGGVGGRWVLGMLNVVQLLNGSVSFQPSITHYMTVNNQGELN